MAKSYDVVVIGAGPAGSVAAMQAAEGGARTLLVEKHHTIGYPVCCAEAISLSGLKNVIEPEEEWIASKISRVRLFAPDGSMAEISHPRAGYVLDRKIFDLSLAEKASHAGAEVQVGVDICDLILEDGGRITGVKALEDGKPYEIKGRVFIAADGVESAIARKAGLDSGLKPKQLHSAYQYLLDDIDIEPETLEFHYGNRLAPGGYFWVFCKGEKSANVGLGVCPSKSPRKKAIAYLNEFIDRRFKRYTIIESMTGGVPCHIPEFPLYKDNLLVAGDAARVVDSLTGAGIANALLSGKIAGETAAKMIKGNASGREYADKFYELKRKELKFYHGCREIFLKLTDDDFNLIIRFVDDMFGGRDVTAVNPFNLVKEILLAHPRLLKLGRHLIF